MKNNYQITPTITKFSQAFLWISILVIMLFSSNMYGQVYNYTFAATNSGSYAAETLSGTYQTGSAVSTNGVSASIPLPWAFVYNGKSYTNIYISNNGFIAFANIAYAAPAASNVTPISTTSNSSTLTNGYDGAIAGFGMDLVASAVGGAAPAITYGPAASGEFMIQYTDLARSGVTTDRISFQIRLAQTTNVVRIIYNTCTASASTSSFPQVGLRGASYFDWKNLTGTTATAWTAPTSQNTAGSAVSTSTIRFTTTATAAAPTAGQTFTWTPAAAQAAPTYATIPAAENFDTSPWPNGVTLQDQPNTANWRTWPTFGDRSWRRNNVTSPGLNSGWASTSGSFTISSPASGGVARFHGFDATTGSNGYMDYYVNFSNAGNKTLTFSLIAPSTADSLKVYLSTDGGVSFGSPVFTSSATVASWTNQSVSLGSSTSATCVVRFEAISRFSTDLGIDNVAINVPCVTPTSLAATVTTTPGVVTIKGSFTAAQVAPSGYLVVRTATNVQPSPVNTTAYTVGNNAIGYIEYVGDTASSWTSTGLTPSTQYYYWVFSYNSGNCTGGPLYSASAAIPSPQPTTNACSLSGTKTIPGDYPALKTAIDDVIAKGVTGPVVFELQPGYTSSSDTFPLILSAVPCASAINTITIQPAAGATNLSITSGNATTTIDINGGNFWVIDGRPGGVGTTKQLTIEDTVTSGTAVRFINEGSNNVIRYTTIRGRATSTTSGVVLFSTTTGANGNDNNTIDSCDVRDGASTPSNGIYSSGTTTSATHNNSGNIISNSNIYNFYNASSATNGILISTGNTDWTITSNSIYQTASRVGVGSTMIGINIGASSGNNFSISGNFIGGTAPLAGSTPLTISGTAAAYRFRGISLSVGNTTPTSVQNNTISNISWVTTSGATTLPGTAIGIYLAAGNANIGNVTGNTISNITAQTSSSGGVAFGIGSDAASSVSNISNNTISGITVTGSSTSVSHAFVGIQTTTGTTLTINGNMIGSTSVANSINASTPSTNSLVQRVSGIENTSSATIAITNNTIANLNSAYVPSSASSSRIMGGIVSSFGVNTITGNKIFNLRTGANATGTSSSASVIGISLTSTTAPTTISQDTIYALSDTNATAAVLVTGIFYSGATSGFNFVMRNYIHSLTSVSPLSIISGIQVGGGTTAYQNNMIALGNGLTHSAQINGILEPLGTDNITHNSVFIGGTNVVSGSINTFALNSTQTINTRSFRENIFYNARSNASGTGTHYAIQVGGTTANPTGLTSNNNLLLANGTGGATGRFNSITRATLLDWQNATGKDSISFSSDPQYIDPTNATAPDLHINASTPTQIEAGGGAVGSAPAVPDDYDGQTRATLTPVDVGADALDGTPLANCSTAVAGTIAATVDSVCPNGSSVLTATGATSNSSFLGITYQWVSSTVDGGPYTAVGGATTTQLNTGALAATRYYKFVVSCSFSALTDSSAQYIIVVRTPPTVAVTPTSGIICNPGGTPISLTASGASTYTWSPTTGLTPTSGTPVSANPSANTTYTVTGTDLFGCTNTATATITVNTIVAATATATQANVCSGGNSQLQVNATQSFTTPAAASYAFSTAAGTALQSMTGATGIVASAQDQTSSVATNIGFTFNFGGTNYTQFSASSNGVMGLGSSAVTTADGNGSTTSPTIIPAWDDMHTGTNGNVQYILNSTSGVGNRILIVEWNYRNFGEAGNFTKTVQAWLYEGTNQIKIVYGANTGIALVSATVGIVSSGSSFNTVNTSTGVNNTSSAQNANTFWPASGTTYIFTPSGAPTFTYLWSPSTFLSSTTISNPVAQTVTATQSYTVTVTGNGGCSATANTVVTVDPFNVAPSVSAPTCAGSTFTVSANVTGGQTPYTYLWSTGATTSNITDNKTAGSYNYSVTVTDACAATNSSNQSIAVTVNALPDVTVTPTSSTYCSPGAGVTLTATGALTYNWSPTINLSPATGAIVVATPSALTNYTITGTDINGCIDTAITIVNVVAKPQNVTATATPNTICAGSTSNLSSTSYIPSSTTVNNYTFATATGAALDLMTGAMVVVSASTDDVPMNTSNGANTTAGASLALPFTFNINGTNYTFFSASPDGWLAFSNSSTAATSSFTNTTTLTSNVPKLFAFWDDLATGTDGSVSTLTTGSAPFRIFKVQWKVTVPRNTTGASNSTFQAWLYESTNIVEFRYGAFGVPTGTSSAGLSNGALFNSITFSSNTASNSSANDGQVGVPSTGRMYTFAAPSAAMTLAWTPADSVVSPAAQNTATKILGQTTNFTFTATNGVCSTSASALVTVNSVTGVISGDATICAGDSTTLAIAVTGTGPWSGTLSDATAFSGNSSPINVKVAPSGNLVYTIATLLDIGTNCTAQSFDKTGSATITVNPSPAVSITGSTSLCHGVSNTLTANATTSGGTITSYQWNLNGSVVADSINSTYDATAAGSYSVTVTNSFGCSKNSTPSVLSFAIVTITPTSGLNGTISPSIPVVIECGKDTTFTFTPNAFYSVDSVTVDGTSVGAPLTYTFTNVTANHTIDVRFKNAACDSPATVSAGASAIICPESNFTPSGAAIGGTAVSAVWTTNGTGTFSPDSAFASSPMYIPSLADITAGTVILTLTTNDPDTTGPCLAQVDTLTITFYTPPSVNITGTSYFCTSNSSLLTANATAGSGTIASYQWIRAISNNLGTASTQSASDTGSYTVIVTNSNGCSTTSAAFNVTEESNPVAGVTADCNLLNTGDTATLTATPASGVTYEWRLNGGAVLSTSNPYVTGVNANGTYRIIVTNAAGCKDSATIVINNITGPLVGGTTYYIPSGCPNFPTIASAVTYLNANGVTGTGAVTFEVQSGYAETAPVGGYIITGTGTANVPVVFKRSAAPNPVITAPVQTANLKTDAIIKIVGADYITIDGFTLNERTAGTITLATATNNVTEFGIALFLASSTNGAQNNTIQNNIINLNTSYPNAIGVFSSSSSSQTNTSMAASSTAGSNSNNKIYGNTISSSAAGVYFICEPITATNFETGNDIGGSSAATANTITFGLATVPDLSYTRFSTTTEAGVYMRNGAGYNIRFNTITANNAAYLTSSGVAGVFCANTAPTGVTYTSTVSNNTINISSTGVTPVTGVDFGYGITTGAIACSNNAITINQPDTIANSAAVVAIKANYPAASNTCSNNTIVFNQSQSNGALSGTTTGITIGGTGTTTINSSNNSVTATQTVTGTGSITGTLTGLASATGTTVTLNDNTFTFSNNSTGTVSMVGLSSSGATTGQITNNTFDLQSTGGGAAVSTITGVSITGGTNNSVFANNFINLSSTGAAATGNTTIHGVRITAGTTNNIYSNFIKNINAGAGSGTSVLNGIAVNGGTTNGLYKNKIASIGTSSTGASSVVSGILISTGTTNNIYNNLIGTFNAANLSSNDAIRGINITSTTANSTQNVFNNTISLNASGGANFGTTGIYHTTSTVATTSALDLRNNIVSNVSVASGTGLTVAYRRSDTNLANYAATSNNNLFYANGAAAISDLLFYDGTNSDQTLAAYGTRVYPRDNASIADTTYFVSVSPLSVNYLHINTAIATGIESGGSNIGFYTDDYDGEVRFGNIGYAGTGTSYDMGADEFNGTPSFTCVAPVPGNTVATPATVCFGQSTLLSMQNPFSGTGYSFQWQSSPNGTAWTNIVGATGLTYTATIDTATYYQCVVTCANGPVSTASTSIQVNFTYTVATTTPGTRCGTGTVSLGATASAGANVVWYANASGGTALATGTTFTTPSISATTTYFATATNGGTSTVGLAAADALANNCGTLSTSSATDWPLRFNSTGTATIVSVDFIPQAAGSVTIALRNSLSSTNLQTASFTFTAGQIGVAQTLTLNFNIAAAGAYQLTNSSGGVHRISTYTCTYPYVSTDGTFSIVGSATSSTGATGTTTYNSFFGLVVNTSGCQSARIPVVATVTVPPAFTITPSHSLCNNSIGLLTADTGKANFDNYQWSPATNLFTDAAATIPYVLGNHADTVYVKSTTPLTTVYTCSALQTGGQQCTNSATTTVTIHPTSITIGSTGVLFCQSGTATLTLSAIAGYTYNSVQWQSSSDSISFTNIPSANSANYNTGLLSDTTYYRALLLDSTGSVCVMKDITITVNDPQILSTTPASRCGTGTLTLGATSSAGSTINWYSAAAGGTSIATGLSFTTPVIGATTTYYASASIGSGLISGLGNTSVPATTGATNERGIVFTPSQNFTLVSAQYYSPTLNVTNTVTVRLYNNTSGTQIGSSLILPVVQGGTAGFYTMNLNLNITTGITYRITAAFSSSVNRISSGADYTLAAFNNLGNVGIINSGYDGGVVSTSYNYFHNISIISNCESARSSIAASIIPPPALSITASQTVCNNTVNALTITTGIADYDSFAWAPVTDLYLDQALTMPYVSGTNASTVYASSATPGTTTYTVSATNYTTSCVNTATTDLTVLPAALTMISTPSFVCNTGSTVLSLLPVSGFTKGGSIWQSSPDSMVFTDIDTILRITYTTPVISATTYYSTQIKNSAGSVCLQPAIKVVVNNPQITGTTPATRCGAGSVTLGATASAGSTINWYAASTGGSSLATGSSFTTNVGNADTAFYAQALIANLSAGTAVVDTQNTTSLTGGPYRSGASADMRVQYLYTASELLAAGLQAGPITALAFNVTSVGDSSLPAFTISMGNTGASTSTTTFNTSPLSTVFGPVSYIATAGINTHNLSPAFNWDGSSNIIIQVCHVASTGNTSSSVAQFNTSGKITYTTGASACTNTTGSTGSSRPVITFSGQKGTICSNARVPVAVTITPAPPISITASQTVCNDIISMLTVTSGVAAYDSFAWTPATDLYTDAAATISYVAGTNVSTVYARTATAGTTVFTLNAFNNTSGCYNSATTNYTVLPASLAIVATPASICSGNSSVITVTPVAGFTYSGSLWQTSPDSVTFTDVDTIIRTSYATPSIDTSTYYSTIIRNSAGAICLQPAIKVDVVESEIISTTGASRCGAGALALAATASPGATINWYANPTSGPLLASGTSFTSPVINATTTYYAAASNGTSTFTGLGNTSVPASSGFTGQRGIVFTPSRNFTLLSAQYYSPTLNVTNQVVIRLFNNSTGVQIGANDSLLIVQGGTAGFYTMNLNKAITAGITYRITATFTSAVNRISTGANYTLSAFNNLGTFGVINSGYDGANDLNSYNYFHNISILGNCEGSRIAVTAAITPPPALSLTPSQTVCNNTISLLTATTGVNDYDSLIWSPATNLFTDAAATVPYIAGATADTVYAMTATPGTITYTVNVKNDTTGCVNSATTGYTVLPASLTMTATATTLCYSGSPVLSLVPVSGFTNGGSLWQSSTDSITFTNVDTILRTTYTPLVDTTTYFSTTIRNSAGAICLQPAIKITVNEPAITGTTPGARCGTGTTAISATTSAGSTVNWYSASTGGTLIGTGSPFTTPAINTDTIFYASAVIGAASSNKTIGAGALTSISTGSGRNHVSPFDYHFGAGKMQYLFRASELNAAGITAGTISSIAFDVVTTSSSFDGFTVSFGTTSLTSLTTTPVSGLTDVYSTVSETPVVGINTYLFNAPFNWNGTSNIVIGVCWGNNNTGGTGSTVKYDAATFSATNYLEDDNVTAAVECAANFADGVVSLRPKTIFNSSAACESARVAVPVTLTPPPALSITPSQTVCNSVVSELVVTTGVAAFDSFAWSPATNLFLDQALTIPYIAGTNSDTVYASTSTPGTTTYTVGAFNYSSGCFNSANTSYTVLPAALTITANPSQICYSGSTTLSLSPATGFTYAGSIWQSSTDSITFTDVDTVIRTSYNTPAIDTVHYYSTIIRNSAGAVCLQPAITIAVNEPAITSTTNATRCGAGTVNLGAAANAGSTINWYANASGGNPVGTGATYTTPVISNNTTYYASASNGTGLSSGLGNTSVPSGTLVTGQRGIVFTPSQNFTLVSAQYYSPTLNVTNTVVIRLFNNSTGVQIGANDTLSIVQGGTAGFYTMNLNKNITTGITYRITASFSASVQRINTGVNYALYAFNNLGNAGVINSGYDSGNDLTSYNYFHNIVVNTSCESGRTPVTVTVTPPPALSITPSQTVCNNVISALTVTTGVSDFDSFLWAPATNLYVDSFATVPYVAGTTADTVYARTSTTGTITYTVSAINDTTGCFNSATTNYTVLPAALTLSAMPAEICFYGTTTISVVSVPGFVYTGSLWQISPDSVTFTTIDSVIRTSYTTLGIDTATYYSTIIRNSAGNICLQPAITIKVNEPAITSFTDSSRCGPGTVTLGATATIGSTIKWYSSFNAVAPVATGTSYTTPVINTTNTYYVTATTGNNFLTGLGNTSIPSGTSVTAERGIVFTAYQDFTLVSAQYYSSTTNVTNTVVVKLFNNTTGIQIGLDDTLQIAQGGTAGFYTMNLNKNITAGITYRITAKFTSSVFRINTGVNYSLSSFNNLGSVGIINSGYDGGNDLTSYNFFHNIAVISGCESGKTAVTATVNTPPPLSAGSDQSICTGDSATLSISTGLMDYDSFTWSPSTGLSDTTGNSVKASPAITTSYIVYATSNTGSLCANFDTVTVQVNPLPVVLATASQNTACGPFTTQISGMFTTGFNPTLTSVSGGGSVVINDNDTASPYPSTLTVSGINNNASLRVVRINGLTHSFPSDIDMVLVSPTGQFVTIFSDMGGSSDITNNNYVFSDSASNFLSTGFNASGSYKPTNDAIGETYPSPGPVVPAGSQTFASLTGNPNGVWKLYIQDDVDTDDGSLTSWSLEFAIPHASGFTWSPTSGLSDPTLLNPTATIASGDTVIYTLTVVDSVTGCLNFDTVTLISKSVPAPIITPGSQTICGGEEIFLQIVDTGAYAISGYDTAITVVNWSGIGIVPANDSVSSSNGPNFIAQVSVNGCAVTTDTVVIDIKLVSVSANITQSTCGNANGKIVASVTSGGTPPYRYVWTQGVTTLRDDTTNVASDSIFNLLSGIYKVVVYDNVGGAGLQCNTETTVTVNNVNGPVASIDSTRNPTCFGYADGYAHADTTGGLPPYTFLWSTGNTTDFVDTLTGGITYTVTVTDANGCPSEAQVTLSQPSELTATTSFTQPTCGGNDGTATVVVSGGTAPYRLDWYKDDGAGSPVSITQYEATATGLDTGIYYILITDTNNCGPRIDTIVVTQTCDATLSLELFIQGYYTGGSPLMNTPLFSNGLSLDANPNHCDVITVELRDPVAPSNVIASATDTLHADGTTNAFVFPGSVVGNYYYIAVKHQNAIQTWSADSVLFGATNSYNFHSSQANAYGSNMIDVGGVWAFYSGDMNQDENVDLSDFPLWDDDNTNFVFGYVVTDLNGDTNADLSDFPFWDDNNTNFIFSSHPF